MKDLSLIIQEKLKINKNSKNKNKNQDAFEEYFDGIPENELKNIWDKYIEGHPFSIKAESALSCTPFELLFTMSAMLIDDELLPNKYEYLGTKWYKMKLHGKNNPYDLSWFEEEFVDDNNNNQDILSYLKEWIKDNYDEFCKIYEMCVKYSEILTLEKIEAVSGNIFWF